MRHVIVVVGSEEQRSRPAPKLLKQDEESVRTTTWYASLDQKSSAGLLDDRSSVFMRILIAPVLAYRFYVLVHNIRLWSSKRPLILVQDRKLASRVAAYAGTWGGGDVVAASASVTMPLGPTRFLLDENGNLKLRAD